MADAEGLGVDIGGVIIDRVHEDRTTSTAPDCGYASATPVEGALAAIAQLRRRRFGDRIWVVSRCDESLEPVLLDWLQRVDFYATTGVGPGHVRFCRERHEKTPICRHLGLTHFIDDRLEVLAHMVGTVPNLYLFQSRAGDQERFAHHLPHVRPIRRWSEVLSELLP